MTCVPIIRSRIGLSNLMDEKTGQTMIITTIEIIDGNSDSEDEVNTAYDYRMMLEDRGHGVMVG